MHNIVKQDKIMIMTFYNNLCKHHFLADAEESQATSNSMFWIDKSDMYQKQYNCQYLF